MVRGGREAPREKGVVSSLEFICLGVHLDGVGKVI